MKIIDLMKLFHGYESYKKVRGGVPTCDSLSQFENS